MVFHKTSAAILVAVHVLTAVAAAPQALGSVHGDFPALMPRNMPQVYAHLYKRQSSAAYPETDQVGCLAGFDTPSSTAGQCTCGPGRVASSSSPGTCENAFESDVFSQIYNVVRPVRVPYAITASKAQIASNAIMTTELCGSICRQSGPACIGYYLQPLRGRQENSCWRIGLPGVYNTTTIAGLPYRQPYLGATGGSYALALGPYGPAHTLGCLPQFNDLPTANLTCHCGSGRQNEGPTRCHPAT